MFNFIFRFTLYNINTKTKFLIDTKRYACLAKVSVKPRSFMLTSKFYDLWQKKTVRMIRI